jgi:biopolymer transport protein ExbD
MIVQPFNFTSRLKQTSVGFDVVPFIDFCLIMVFFTLAGSPFVVAPGLTVNLPSMRAPTADAVPTSRVLTVGEVEGRELIIFDNRVQSLETLERTFAEHPASAQGEVLLLRLKRDVSVQLLLQVNELAMRAGFAAVQIAAEPEQAASGGFQ